jgi:hypothetical protein
MMFARRCAVLPARAGLLVLVGSFGFSVQAAQAQTETPDQSTARLHVELSVDVGGSGAGVAQVLPVEWRPLFQPPNDRMTTDRSDHAWFVELRAGVEPAFVINQWKIGVPVSYSFLGSAWAAGASVRAYVYRKPVAGTKLDWWNPVLLHATAVEKTLPAIGVSVQRGRVVFQASFQAYRILGEDFRGEDCSGCANTSHLVGVQELSRGVGYRVDVLFQHDDSESVDPAVGIFFEQNGPKIWQSGVRLRLRFTVAGYRKGQST